MTKYLVLVCAHWDRAHPPSTFAYVSLTAALAWQQTCEYTHGFIAWIIKEQA